MKPFFELQKVGHQFDQLPTVTHISLSVFCGEIVALVGPSGAGKSTLLNLLNGSLIPTSGQILVLGHGLHQVSTRQRRQLQQQIGTIYQQHYLVPNLSVIHNVNAGHLGRWSLLKAMGSLLWPQDVETAAQALAQVGIAEKLYARTNRLSGGQQQRVAIAKVLVQDPEVILADEPIASVDPERAREIMDLLRRLCQERGKTLVVSLHDIDFARSHCDRMIGLRAGQVLFDKPTEAVTEAMVEDLYRL